MLQHQPVLYQEIIEALQPQRGFVYIDCTLGSGGHASGILESSSPDGRLIGFEIDPIAFEIACTKLRAYSSRTELIQDSYVNITEYAEELGLKKVMGILIDLGASSIQLDMPERGFSFRDEATLDMRFSPESKLTAYDVVNNYPESELANLIKKFGEEKNANRIAREIVLNRPVRTTKQLAKIIEKVVKQRPKKNRQFRRHPATQTFQAIRIVVNNELQNLKEVLPEAVNLLDKNGRLAVISFHSLEDRIVKRFFRRESIDCLCPPKQPICTCGHTASIKILNRRPIVPTQEEIANNPRSRSARLRIVEKII
ncbi:MAG: 16S rRNA (cytosine(1402)-N(4))-methyltransferase RsmH [Anaerolineales bacterium]